MKRTRTLADYFEAVEFIVGNHRIFRYRILQDQKDSSYDLADLVDGVMTSTYYSYEKVKKEKRHLERKWQQEQGRSYHVQKTSCPKCGSEAEYDCLDHLDSFDDFGCGIDDGTYLFCQNRECTAIFFWQYSRWVNQEGMIGIDILTNDDLPF